MVELMESQRLDRRKGVKMSKGKIAIVGIGEVPTGIYPQRLPWEIIYETCTQAVQDSGLDKDDIEAVVTVAPQAQARLSAEISFGKIPEELGLKGCKDVCICNAGGASTSNCLRLAEHLIDSGAARAVLIPHVTVHSCIQQDELIEFFAQAGMDLQWEYPFGTTYNAIVGMITRRYMHESGATPEEMASIVVSMRKWAALDPNSMFFNKKVPSVEEILSSPMVADPLHKRECNMLADGGAAMVVTSAELAPKVTSTPVYKLGEGSVFFTACPVLRDHDMWSRGFRDSAAKAISEAGLTKEDIDIWNIYLAYPVGHPIMMEALGLCEPGQGCKAFMDGSTWPGGKMPWSTIGDAIGRGHTGSGVSTATYVETARQLMGKAGSRQVEGARFVFQNTSGGSGMNNIATVWGKELI
jgi:acetyl-CoA C-acetyltransferase